MKTVAYSPREARRSDRLAFNCDNPIPFHSSNSGRIKGTIPSWKNYAFSGSCFNARANTYALNRYIIVPHGFRLQQSSAISEPSRNLALRILRDVLERCQSLAHLGEGWDGEDAQPVKQETIQRAVNFLIYHFTRALALRGGTDLSIPKVGAVHDGSVDLYWKTPRFRFLVNIPDTKDAPATFFGERIGASRARGSVEPGAVCDLLIDFLNV